MKLLALLIVLLGSLWIFAADGPEKKPPSEAFGLPFSQAETIELDRKQHPAQFARDQYWPSLRSSERKRETVICYKIRSYHIAREDRDSDVTRVDGYSTCQLATHFAVKKATAVDMDSQ